MLHHLSQDPDLRVIEIISDLHCFDFGNQVFDSRMLNQRLVDQIISCVASPACG